MRRRSVRIGLTLLVTGLAVAYLIWKVDIHEIVDTLLDADPWWFAFAVAIMAGTALPMALRWQWLMRAQRMDDSFWSECTISTTRRPAMRASTLRRPSTAG